MNGNNFLSRESRSQAPSRVLWGVEKVMVAEIGTNKKPLSCVEPLERKGIKGEILANAILHKLGHPVQRTDGFIKFNGDICAAGKGAGVFAGFSPSWRPAPSGSSRAIGPAQR